VRPEVLRGSPTQGISKSSPGSLGVWPKILHTSSQLHLGWYIAKLKISNFDCEQEPATPSHSGSDADANRSMLGKA